MKAGKNQGRKNETGPVEQAKKEAHARWTKKKKSGYVESLEGARQGKVDEVIAGGLVPMLAKVYQDHIPDFEHPVYVQPKLDGGRMIAMIDGEGKVTLWSRTRKPITSVPHIVEKLEKLIHHLDWKNCALDGECYNHDLKDNFEKLMSAFRKKKTSPEALDLQYHIYDFIDLQNPQDYSLRLNQLHTLASVNSYKSIEVVLTATAEDETHVMHLYSTFKEAGYEGAMVRSSTGAYEHKRSTQLLKLKGFLDDEFTIIGFKEGRGKLQGHVGSFTCAGKGNNGERFDENLS